MDISPVTGFNLSYEIYVHADKTWESTHVVSHPSCDVHLLQVSVWTCGNNIGVRISSPDETLTKIFTPCRYDDWLLRRVTKPILPMNKPELLDLGFEIS